MNRDRLNVAYLILGVASLIVIGFGVFSLMEIEHQQSREVQEEIAGNLSRPVWNYNIPTINSILNQTMLFNPFQEIAVYDLDGTALYENRNTQLNQEEGLKLFFFPRTSSSMRILYQSEVIGTLKIIAVNRSIYSIAVFVLLCLLAVGLLANLFHSRRQNRLLKDSLSEVIHLQEQLIETRHHAALGALLRGLAHEINTPLGNAILLVNNIDPNHQIENRMDPAKAQKTALENINTAIPLLNTALRRIVNIIQRFKQLEASTDVEENYDYSVEDIFKESWFVASQVFMDQAQKTYFSVMGEPRVQGPKNALLTIFVELISNTLQHSVSRDTKGNKVEIRVKCRRKKGVLEITYENNGIPVPAKIHDKMFDPFTRGRTSTENMGIGLHIVSYLLSTLFNGRISYTYREGRNCFLLSFEEQGQSSGRKNG